jgi:hypothetical protein
MSRREINVLTGEETVDETWTPPPPPPEPDYDALDAAALNAALATPGSIFRALAELTFTEINKLRVKGGDVAYTKAQFVAALKARMRG